LFGMSTSGPIATRQSNAAKQQWQARTAQPSRHCCRRLAWPRLAFARRGWQAGDSSPKPFWLPGNRPHDGIPLRHKSFEARLGQRVFTIAPGAPFLKTFADFPIKPIAIDCCDLKHMPVQMHRMSIISAMRRFESSRRSQLLSI
jgi:hypothetical protein